MSKKEWTRNFFLEKKKIKWKWAQQKKRKSGKRRSSVGPSVLTVKGNRILRLLFAAVIDRLPKRD